MSVLAVSRIVKSYGGVHAVADVSFSVEYGQIVALIGPNGAGKSTCFNILNGQIRPDSGSVIFNGFEIAGGHPRENCRLGIGRTFQVPETYGSMTVCENVQMVYVSKHRTSFNPWLPVGRLYRDEAMAVLERIGIASQAQRPASVLAYGDVKRLELAIAIASDPILLLMDEPAAGMSPAERIDLMKLTDSLVRERNLAVLFTEHSMDVVFAYAHHILVLSRGKLIASGTPASVRDNHEVQEVYLGSSAFLDLSGTAVT
jgi:branched-chain amino acid transport system ATP-binding protein